jgi:pyruvate,water dikinase
VEALHQDDLAGISALSDRLRTRFQNTPVPEELYREILAAYAQLCRQDFNSPLAVRSSATTEDSQDASFAGLQDTYLWVKGAEAMIENVRSCWASLYSLPSISYRRKHGIPESEVSIAVVVQKMVNARTAGVMFTRSPVTGDRSVVTIEATWGLGSALVSGEVTPDRFVISKITSELMTTEISDKHLQHVPAEGGGVEVQETPEDRRRAASITAKELIALKEIARHVERHYGRSQDIEWAIDNNGEIFLLQSRPETVWSVRTETPIAKPAESSFHHVMNIFGGRR